MTNFKQILDQRILILDGAMGTMIQKHKLTEEDYRGLPFADFHVNIKGNNDILVLTQPQIIRGIHEEYLTAGADIIETNTFNANSISMQDYDMASHVREINVKAAQLAKEAAMKFTALDPSKPRFVAGSIGPTNKTASMSPDVNNPAYRAVYYDELVTAYCEQIEALMDGGVDLILIETIFDTLNAKAAMMAADLVFKKMQRSLPMMLSATVADTSGRTLSGQTIEAFAASVSHFPILSIGLNCSFGAKDLKSYLHTLSKISSCYISVHPNAGLPNQFGAYDETPETMAVQIKDYFEEGLVNIIGGCCGTSPAHIKAIADLAKQYPPRIPKPQDCATVISGLETLRILPESNFVNIGERCNVAGSRKFVRLIKEKKYEEALSIAQAQVETGAQIIDINMDDAMLESKEEMVHFLNLIASEPEIARLPIMIDSSKWEVIEAGLKCVQGKCIVNSISLKEGEAAFIEKAQLIRQYGAAVVVMAFDETGQADSLERKIAICERAYQILTQVVHFAPQDIIFDPNVLAIATGMEEHNNYALDFIECARWIKAHLPHAKISGGISNLSFSFRGNDVVREAIHSVFLYHAIQAGLDMGIVNPALLQVYSEIDPELLELVEHIVLNQSNEATERLIEFAEKLKAGGSVVQQKQANNEWRNQTLEERLAHALIKGIAEYLEEDLQEALIKYPLALTIIEQPLMDGMNVVGELFGSGKMFLPQVVKTARTMKKAVAILLPYIEAQKQHGESHSAGKILLATVKGDVHDIGKNIVGVILACNNYEIIDLGVMVSTERILDEAIKQQVDIVGVSGLITPSLEEMEEIAQEMQKRKMKLPLLIGGATTSKIHTAFKIAPHYDHEVIYVKDASKSVAVVSKLMHSKERLPYFEEIKKEYEAVRLQHQSKSEFLSLEQVRKKGLKIDWKQEDIIRPASVGIPVIADRDLQLVRSYIDWSYFFIAWRMPGQFKDGKALTPEAQELYKDAQELLDRMEQEHRVGLKSIVAFYSAASEGDDIVIYTDETQEKEQLRFNMLRQQKLKKDATAVYRSLSDFVAPKHSGVKDYIGVFAANGGIGIAEFSEEFKAAGDDYNALLVSTLGDRLAEALVELLHEEVRVSLWGYAPNEKLSLKELLKVKYSGIRPAIGYPSLPDQSENFKIDELFHLQKTLGIAMTEHGAMSPSASVSGLIIAHPQASYFGLDKINEEQLLDYAQRKQVEVKDIRKWVKGNL